MAYTLNEVGDILGAKQNSRKVAYRGNSEITLIDVVFAVAGLFNA